MISPTPPANSQVGQVFLGWEVAREIGGLTLPTPREPLSPTTLTGQQQPGGIPGTSTSHVPKGDPLHPVQLFRLLIAPDLTAAPDTGGQGAEAFSPLTAGLSCVYCGEVGTGTVLIDNNKTTSPRDGLVCPEPPRSETGQRGRAPGAPPHSRFTNTSSAFQSMHPQVTGALW